MMTHRDQPGRMESVMALHSVAHGGVTQGVRAADHCCHLHHHLDSFSVLFLWSEYLSVGVLSLHMGGDVRHRERWGGGVAAGRASNGGCERQTIF